MDNSGVLPPRVGGTRDGVTDTATSPGDAPNASADPRQSPIATVRFARRAWRAFLESWREAPPESRRRWLVVSGAGFACCLVLTAAVSFGAHRLAERGKLGWDATLLHLVQTVVGDLSVHDAIWLSAFASSAMLIPLVVMVAIWSAIRGRVFHSLTITGAFIGTKVLLVLAALMWSRPRPDSASGGIVVPEGLPSYPSGHTTQAVTVYGILCFFWMQRSRSPGEKLVALILLTLMILLTALARLRLGAHWPSDIAAGALIGLVLLVVLIHALRSALGEAE